MQWCGLDGELLVDAPRDPLIGKTLDRYRVIEQLGVGGMGCVYRARHAVIDREYAIKVLFGDFACDEKFQARFKREAQSVSKIRHPNIVSVEDFGTTPQGLTFLVMELVRGRTLEALIEAEAPLSPARTARILRQIAAGLGAAHRLGFVHRDVKPSNMMLTDGESVKILDFGAVNLRSLPTDQRLTTIGHIIGTPTYMAPEQTQDPNVGPPADLYALGVLAFEMLTGQPPFTGPGRAEILIKHLTEDPPPLPPSGGLERLVAQLLSKLPEQRPQSSEEVIRLLDGLPLHQRSSDLFRQAADTRPPIEPSEEAYQATATTQLAVEPSEREDRRRVLEIASTGPATLPSVAAQGAAHSGQTTSPAMPIAAPWPDPATSKLDAPLRSVADVLAYDTFPSLDSAVEEHDWPTWSPEGVAEITALQEEVSHAALVRPVREPSGETDPTRRAVAMDGTLPQGLFAPWAVPGPKHTPAPQPRQGHTSTMVVRERAVTSERAAPSKESGEGLLFEPQRPDLGPVRTDDDGGPTQVDFQIEVGMSGELAALSAEAPPPLVIPTDDLDTPEGYREEHLHGAAEMLLIRGRPTVDDPASFSPEGSATLLDPRMVEQTDFEPVITALEEEHDASTSLTLEPVRGPTLRAPDHPAAAAPTVPMAARSDFTEGSVPDLDLPPPPASGNLGRWLWPLTIALLISAIVILVTLILLEGGNAEVISLPSEPLLQPER